LGHGVGDHASQGTHWALWRWIEIEGQPMRAVRIAHAVFHADGVAVTVVMPHGNVAEHEMHSNTRPHLVIAPQRWFYVEQSVWTPSQNDAYFASTALASVAFSVSYACMLSAPSVCFLVTNADAQPPSARVLFIQASSTLLPRASRHHLIIAEAVAPDSVCWLSLWWVLFTPMILGYTAYVIGYRKLTLMKGIN
jgi:hypothetical protein